MLAKESQSRTASWEILWKSSLDFCLNSVGAIFEHLNRSNLIHESSLYINLVMIFNLVWNSSHLAEMSFWLSCKVSKLDAALDSSTYSPNSACCASTIADFNGATQPIVLDVDRIIHGFTCCSQILLSIVVRIYEAYRDQIVDCEARRKPSWLP